METQNTATTETTTSTTPPQKTYIAPRWGEAWLKTFTANPCPRCGKNDDDDVSDSQSPMTAGSLKPDGQYWHSFCWRVNRDLYAAGTSEQTPLSRRDRGGASHPLASPPDLPANTRSPLAHHQGAFLLAR